MSEAHVIVSTPAGKFRGIGAPGAIKARLGSESDQQCLEQLLAIYKVVEAWRPVGGVR